MAALHGLWFFGTPARFEGSPCGRGGDCRRGSSRSGRARAAHFSDTGAGTNQVNIQTGELRELWTGRAKPFGKIKTHVAGSLQIQIARLAVHASMVIAVPSGDVLIGACTGAGILPGPDGQDDWTRDATGGTGKFEASTGQWKPHIDIHRISLENGVQKNRFTETASGRSVQR